MMEVKTVAIHKTNNSREITSDEFADAVASALLDYILWQHLPQEDSNAG